MFPLNVLSLLLLLASSNALSVVPPAVEIVVQSPRWVDISPKTPSTIPQRELLKSAVLGYSSVSLSAATTAPPTAAATTKSADIVISHINYDGKVPTTESDEYVVLTNASKNVIDVSGYYLYVATSGTQGATFIFPKDSVVKPNASVRVYTNEIHKESGGYSFGSAKAIWNNRGGLAVLKDGKGTKLGEFKYKGASS